MSPARRRICTAGAVLLLYGPLTACVPQGLAFRADQRLSFVSPEDRSTVSLPVKVDWDIRDFEVVDPGQPVGEDEGYFGVFVDRAPVPPGEPLSWIARDDDDCRAADGCPDEEYLAARGVYATTETEMVFEQIPRTNVRAGQDERHRVVVVLLDADGRRIGESAFEIAFDLDRSST